MVFLWQLLRIGFLRVDMATPFSHYPIGPWPLGLVNRLRATEIPDAALYDAVNTNVREDGSLLSRISWEPALQADNCHSLFGHGDRTFCVVDGAVSELDPDGATTLSDGPVSPQVGDAIHWTVLNNEPVFATGQAVYRVDGRGIYPLEGDTRDDQDMDDVLIPLPGGQWVDYWNGRLIVARGTSLLFSEPLRYGAHNPVTGYIRLPARIEWVAPLETGIFVGLNGPVLFLAGSTPTDLRQTQVAQGSAPGMALTMSGENLSQEVAATPRVAVFFTRSGFTIGMPDGSVVYPQQRALRDLPLFRGKLYVDKGRIYAIRGF